MSTGARTCPVCGTGRARSIVHGLPSPDLLEDPEVVLGGCVVDPSAPRFVCRDPGCATRFGTIG